MKFTPELAAKVRDELFLDEERILLSTVVGRRYIDVATKLLALYGRYDTLAKTENEFLDNFAFRKADVQSSLIIAQLKTYSEQLDKLTNPKYFYKEGDSTTISNTTLVNNFESKTDNTDNSASYSYAFDESSNQNKTGTLVRGAATQTSLKNKGIENKWKKDLLLDVKAEFVKEKQIDKAKLLSDEFKLDVANVEYEVVSEAKEEPEDVGAELYSQLNLGVTGTISTNYNATGTENVAIAKAKGDVKSESETYSNTGYDVHKDYKSFIHNDATLRVLRLSVAKLQSKYFNLFADLFKL